MNQKITFPELVELLARKQKCSKREAEIFLRELVQLMTDVVSSGESLRINSLGVFKSVWVESRASVNVQTGEPSVIPGHYKLTFTPAKHVREAINEPFSCFSVEILPDDAPILQETIDEMEVQEENLQRQEADSEVLCDDDNVTDLDKDADVENELSYNDSISSQGDAEPEKFDEKADDVSLNEVNKPIEECVEEQPVAEDKEDNVVCVTDENKAIEEDACDIEVASEKIDEKEVVEERAIYDDENNNSDNISSTYRKGLWTGIMVATTIFAVVMLLLYIYFVRMGNYTMKSDDYTTPVVDTIQRNVVVEDVTLLDTLVADTNVQVVDSMPSMEPPRVKVDTIRSGVFLTNISLRHYGHKAFWVYIYEENKGIISNPDLIPIGTVVTIPPAEKYGINPTDTNSVNIALSIANEIKLRKRK